MLLLYLDVEHIVSVPYRGATFLNQSKSPIIKSLGKVSVPYRGATFLNKSISTYARKLHAVSVPYRGATFLNVLLFFIVLPPVSFRPLSGSYISQLLIGNVTCLIKMFPSPIGELHFSIIHNKQEVWQWQSFRPLSGSYISQYIINNIKIRTWWFPSPIGELHFSIEKITPLNNVIEFPSPIGELHFSIEGKETIERIKSVFPSPIGELHFSIKKERTRDYPAVLFPSPIGELHFSIISRRTYKFNWRVSVPYRGATFLNRR